MPQSIRVDIDDYLNAYGRAPRGSGLWIFNVGDIYRGRWLQQHFSFTGKYSDAKRAAIRHARENGCTIVVVRS